MTMYYLVESTGSYDDYQENALEFSEDLEYLENKANLYNLAAEKATKLFKTEAKTFYNQYKILLDRDLEKKFGLQRSSSGRYEFRKEQQNSKIRLNKSEEISLYTKQFTDNYIQQYPIPENLKEILSITESGELDIVYDMDYNYHVHECMSKPSIAKWIE